VAFAWGGFTVVHWEFPAVGATLAILPFFFLLTLARRSAGVALGTFLLFAGGYTQIAYAGFGLAALALSVRSLGRPVTVRFREGLREVLAWMGWAALGIALAAPQILASAEASRLSPRLGVGSEARDYLLNVAHLLKFVVPTIIDKSFLPFDTPVFGPGFWEVRRAWLNTFFLGTAAPLLAVAGWRRSRRGVLLLLSVGVGVALSLGLEPLFSTLRAVVPGLRYMTHFSTAMVMVVFALPLMSMEGFSCLGGERWKVAAALGILLVAPLALSPELRGFALSHMIGIDSLTPAQEDWVRKAASAGILALALVGVGGTLPRGARTAALLALTMGELWRFGHDLQPTVKTSFFHARSPVLNLRTDPSARLAHTPELDGTKPLPGRTLVEGYAGARQVLYPNIALPYRVHAPWGYEVFGHGDYAAFRRTLDRRTPGGPVLDFLAVRDFLAYSTQPAPALFRAQGPAALLYENPRAMERVSVVGRARAVERVDERLRDLSTTWDPRQEVIFANPPAGDAGGTAPRLEAWKDRPGKLAAEGAGAGWLVFGNVDYPGWNASVNGEPAMIRRANHAFMAVAVPPGPWRSYWRYRPTHFHIGLLLTTSTLIGGALCSLRRLRTTVSRI
jgi:hypothetical protein